MSKPEFTFGARNNPSLPGQSGHHVAGTTGCLDENDPAALE
jgi:hypothetical protein